MSGYPLPAYAVHTWIAGDNLMVAFPGTASERGHTITLPATVAGLQTAINIMKERAQARDLRLSQRGTPTQYEVENDRRYRALVAANGAERERKAREAEEAAEFLKELGL